MWQGCRLRRPRIPTRARGWSRTSPRAWEKTRPFKVRIIFHLCSRGTRTSTRCPSVPPSASR
nr:MAG: hypothetical protein [Molluscum contagiosum virus]